MPRIALSLQYHDELNPKLWNGNELRSDVRSKLLEIAEKWREYAKVPKQSIHDITITGGNANFNYSPNSDIDVHFLIDTSMLPISDPTILQDYMKSKKDMWAANHNIYVKGYSVELYAQNVNEHIPTQQGVYSLKNNKWVIEPENLHLDWEHDFGLRTKVHEQMRKIDSVVNNNESIEQAKAVRDHITKLRGESIQKAGEFSIPNLIFKALRNNGYLDKITKYIREREDKQLSLESVEHGLKFKVDNPGGDWPKYKQEDAEVRYYNGGEDAEGPLHPDKLKQLHKE